MKYIWNSANIIYSLGKLIIYLTFLGQRWQKRSVITHLHWITLTLKTQGKPDSHTGYFLESFSNFPKSILHAYSGWVVTWFLRGYTVRMFEYTVRTFWSNVGRFLYIFSSIPRKLYTIFQPTFSPIKRYQDSIFKLLTLSSNSVTNVVRTAYFQIQARSSPLKILWQGLYSK